MATEPNYQLIRYQADNIPKFDGNPKQINRFINACENFFNNHKDRANNGAAINVCLFDTVLNKLVGRAADLIASRVELNTWPLLKAAVIATFSDQRSIDCVLQDIITSKPEKNENPQQFGLRLQDARSLLFSKINMTNDPVATKLLKITEYESLILKTFIHGLNYHMQLVVRLKSPKTLEEAMTLTSEEENFLYYKNRNSTLNNKTSLNSNANNANKSRFQTPHQGPHSSNMHPRNMHAPRNLNYNSYQRPPFQQSTVNYYKPGYDNQQSSNVFRQQSPIQRPYFGNQNHVNPNFGQRSFFRPFPNNQNQRVLPSAISRFTKPEPMDTSSGNTVINNNNRFIPQQRRNFVSEELFNQSVEPIPENNANYDTNEFYDNPEDDSQYYPEYNETLYPYNEPTYSAGTERYDAENYDNNPYENPPNSDGNFQETPILKEPT